MIELSPNALTVLEKRYLLRNLEGQIIETPEGMFQRVARYIAQAESRHDPLHQSDWEDKFYQSMANLEFLPNSPTLFNAGKDGTLSGCFFLSVDDSMVSIMDIATKAAMIQKHGGGVGYGLSNLRSKGALIKSTQGKACGPIAVMSVYHEIAMMITQGGKREGAQMAVLHCDHPDVYDFVKCKVNNPKFSSFNLSVACTNKFMNKVEVEGSKEKELFDFMCHSAWSSGDPGIFFIDEVNRHNPTPWLGDIEGVNPCGEVPLLHGESCNLGSINLTKFLDIKKNTFDWEKLRTMVILGVRFLDDVIDMNHFPLPIIKTNTEKTRKIGLGVMGWADSLIILGIQYASSGAIELAGTLMSFIDNEARNASINLAKERGPFPECRNLIDPIRNATRTTIAPTGSLSIIANCSSGIEPLFAIAYTRTILEGTKMSEVNPYFQALVKKTWPQETLDTDKIITNHGSIKGLGYGENFERLFVTAHDISPEYHIMMLSKFQQYTNNGISKSINMPDTATVEDVARSFKLAYTTSCKGITIYRDGSKENQVLQAGETKPQVVTSGPRKRPLRVQGFTDKIVTGCGNMYVTVNVDDKGPCEVFVHLGKSGACACAQLEATCRMISLALRSGVALDNVVEQLKGIRCPSPSWDGTHATLSCSDAIAKVLIKELDEDEIKKVEVKAVTGNTGGQCPDCSGVLIYSEGCYHCLCGFTKCG